MMFTKENRGSLWPLTGLGFVVAAGSGILFSTLLPPEPYPSPFGAPLGPQTDVARFFIESHTQVVLMSFTYSIAAIFLVCFVACIASLVWRHGRDADAWAFLSLGGGLLAAGFWLLAAMLLWVLARPWTPEQPSLVRAMHDLTYLVGGPAHMVMLGLFVGAGTAGLRGEQGIPGPLRWVGVVGAALSLLTVLALVADPASLLLPVGRALAMLWIAGVAIWLAFSTDRSQARAGGRIPVAGVRVGQR